MGIQLNQLEIRLGDFHLGPLSFDFLDKGIHLVRGKNGSGKTSLLKVLARRLHFSNGRLGGLPPQLAAVGMGPLLMKTWTVEENLAWLSQLINRPLSGPLIDRLSKMRSQKIEHLSQGMNRQVELSIALSADFSLLLLDEALSVLDSEQRRHYLSAIEAYAANHPVIMVTHHEEELPKAPVKVLSL